MLIASAVQHANRLATGRRETFTELVDISVLALDVVGSATGVDPVS